MMRLLTSIEERHVCICGIFWAGKGNANQIQQEFWIMDNRVEKPIARAGEMAQQ